jgi:hypothetical protein
MEMSKEPKKTYDDLGDDYAERQTAWIKEHKIVSGDIVRVVNKCTEPFWVEDPMLYTGDIEVLNGAVGCVMKIDTYYDGLGFSIGEYDTQFPYTMLEKVFEKVTIGVPVIEEKLTLDPIEYTVTNKIVDYLMGNGFVLMKADIPAGYAYFMEECPTERIFRVKVEPAILTVVGYE